MDTVNYLTRTGVPVSLVGRALGKGGEGQVLPVAGAPPLVAKIFDNPTMERRMKLSILLRQPAPRADGHPSVTWPSDILFTNEPQPKFAGYIMRRLTAAGPVFTYYNQAIRQTQHPAFDYRYLVRSARNIAAVVALVHSQGYVIGDLNETNVFIGEDSLATLIDVDSWQIVDTDTGVTYRCPVGRLDFAAPELHGKTFALLDRQPEHDSFALGILLFKLLNEGTHPFDGLFHGRGDPPPLEQRIRSGRFPYRDRSGLWTPTPLAPPFDSLHPRLQDLFIQAFELGHADPHLRPDARTWQEALAQAERDFRACSTNPTSHWHWNDQCIWCDRKAQLGGLDPFPPRRRVHRRPQQQPPSTPGLQEQPAVLEWEPHPTPSCQPRPRALRLRPAIPPWRPAFLPARLAANVQAFGESFDAPPELVIMMAILFAIPVAMFVALAVWALLTYEPIPAIPPPEF